MFLLWNERLKVYLNQICHQTFYSVSSFKGMRFSWSIFAAELLWSAGFAGLTASCLRDGLVSAVPVRRVNAWAGNPRAPAPCLNATLTSASAGRGRLLLRERAGRDPGPAGLQAGESCTGGAGAAETCCYICRVKHGHCWDLERF